MVLKKVVGLVMVAVMLASTAISYAQFNGTKVAKSHLVSQNWLYSPTGDNPLNPLNYQPGSTTSCDGFADICAITAPRDEEYYDEFEVEIPEISPDLALQINAKAGADVHLMN